MPIGMLLAASKRNHDSNWLKQLGNLSCQIKACPEAEQASGMAKSMAQQCSQELESFHLLVLPSSENLLKVVQNITSRDNIT